MTEAETLVLTILAQSQKSFLSVDDILSIACHRNDWKRDEMSEYILGASCITLAVDKLIDWHRNDRYAGFSFSILPAGRELIPDVAKQPSFTPTEQIVLDTIPTITNKVFLTLSDIVAVAYTRREFQITHTKIREAALSLSASGHLPIKTA